MSEKRQKNIHRKGVTEHVNHLQNKEKHQRTGFYTTMTYRLWCYYQVLGQQEGLTLKKMVSLL